MPQLPTKRRFNKQKPNKQVPVNPPFHFGMIRSCRSLIASLLFFVAPADLIAAEAPYNDSLAQFCINLQPKANQSANPDEMIKITRLFAAQNGWKLAWHNHNQRGMTARFQYIFYINEIKQLRLSAFFVSDRLRGMRNEIYHGSDPATLTVFNTACNLFEHRQIRYLDDGRMERITVQRSGKADEQIWINPPLLTKKNDKPPATVPAIIVGHIDSGIDYRRTDFQPHLIYDQDGDLVALDLWDGDRLPFDANLARSPFYPQSHGSYVVDVLRKIGTDFQLLPVRYPRQNMRLMQDAVEWLATHKAQIVMMPLGSRDADEWEEFFAAAVRHPEMLFIISAGNNGLDLGKQPIYPAVNQLSNAITVTSTLGNGTVADGVNFGKYVGIGLPAENLTATGVNDQETLMSGSSFAVPKLAAYAICIAAGGKDKAMDGAELAAAITQSIGPQHDNTGYGLFLSDSQLNAVCAPYRRASQ